MGPLAADIERDLDILMTWAPKHLATQAKMYAPKDKGKDEKPKQ